MVIMGIDQSFSSCGVVIIENGDMIHAELIKTKKGKDSLYTRAIHIANTILSLMRSKSVSKVALEGLAFNMRGDATRDLGGLQYVIACGILQEFDFEPIIIAPTSLKKFAAGKGNADKMQMLDNLPQSVREHFDGMNARKTTGLLDLSDAYWLAKCYEEKLNSL